MDKTHVTKGILSAAAGVLGYLTGCMDELIIVLILLMLMDYLLGIAAVFFTGEKFDTMVAVRGALKKMLYGFVFILGYLADFIIIYLLERLGIALPVKAMLGVVATLYLIGTEGLSIGKNAILIGLPASDTILKFYGLLKDEAGKITKMGGEHLED